MKIVAISDTHCHDLTKLNLPEADMLIHAGDALSHGTYDEWKLFLKQITKLNYRYKIYVAGNHDKVTEKDEGKIRKECINNGIIYLRDEETVIEEIKIYGSPITPRFHDWAWNRDSLPNVGTSRKKGEKGFRSIKPYWTKIPDDVDILITHGPPKGIFDVSVYDGKNCGCPLLKDRVEVIKPRYHIFGHIHRYGGLTYKVGDITYINTSVCDERYKPTNEIVSFSYE